MKNQTQPFYHSKYTFLHLVDKLPTGPEWTCRLVHVHGDLGPLDENNVAMEGEIKELELWMHDPVACIQELMGNPAFDRSMAYAPEKVYTNTERQTHRYNKMWTADWWWDMQVSRLTLFDIDTHLKIAQTWLPAGETISPVILASDKTELLQFKGDKTAWPVYLTIGNISKDVCHEPSCHASVLLGYLPVSNSHPSKTTQLLVTAFSTTACYCC